MVRPAMPLSMKIHAAVIALLLMGTATYAQREGGAIAAVDEGVGGGPAATSPATKSRSSRPPRRADPKPKATSRTAAPPAYSGPVIGDKYSFLNFEVVDAVKPVHTNAAKQAGARGLVQVEILIGTDGRVLTARGRTGNKLLWPEAERAALASRLIQPRDANGRAVRAIGFIVYRFGPPEEY